MVSHRCLGGRGEERFGKLAGLDQALRQLDAADGAIPVVGLFTGTREVAAHNALDGDRLGFLHEHGAPGQIALIGSKLFR